MATGKYFDNNTLYVKSGVAQPEQLKDSLRKAIGEASRLLGKPLKVFFEVNLIVLREGRKVGFGYIRVSNSEVFHLLAGRNADGSERVEYIDDPDWVEPESDDETDMSIKPGQSWADFAEEEERHICPKIKRVLPPLLTLPGYPLDGKQQAEYKQQVIENAKREGTYEEGMENTIFVPVVGTFETSPAFVTDIDDNLCANVLCTRKVPAWVTEEKLKSTFMKYASDATTKQKRRVGGQTITDTYPFVSINQDRNAFITFDPKTHDAQFALLMTKKLDLQGEGGKATTLIFTHSYQTKSQRT